jgi:hypothetical protein
MKRIWNTLFMLLILLPIIAWGNSINWDPLVVNLYVLFPLLGLLTFLVVWIQVLVGAFPKYFVKYFSLDTFYARTGLAVLILFISHPVVAIIAQYVDLGVLPLESVFMLAPDHTRYIIMGMMVFVIWLIYEILLRLSSFPNIKKVASWWEHIADIGILLIWVHGYNLGSHTQYGWFGYVWWFLGITAFIFISWKIVNKVRSVMKNKSAKNVKVK